MNREDVKNLMRSSKTENEWNENCDKVKKEFNGYPDFWYMDIIMSGLLNETKSMNLW